jgi:hypothetical protein
VAGLDPESDGLLPAALAYYSHGFIYDADRLLDRLGGITQAAPEYHLLRAAVRSRLGDEEGVERQLNLAGRDRL